VLACLRAGVGWGCRAAGARAPGAGRPSPGAGPGVEREARPLRCCCSRPGAWQSCARVGGGRQQGRGCRRVGCCRPKKHPPAAHLCVRAAQQLVARLHDAADCAPAQRVGAHLRGRAAGRACVEQLQPPREHSRPARAACTPPRPAQERAARTLSLRRTTSTLPSCRCTNAVTTCRRAGAAAGCCGAVLASTMDAAATWAALDPAGSAGARGRDDLQVGSCVPGWHQHGTPACLPGSVQLIHVFANRRGG
jgi:hypothetical protein